MLPTYGAARAHSGLSLESFCKTMTVQRLTEEGVLGLAPTVERLARLEGLEAHARSVALRRSALGAEGSTHRGSLQPAADRSERASEEGTNRSPE